MEDQATRTPRGHDKVRRLLEKGVDIPNPLSLDIGGGVDVDRISGRGVRIYPGCRIYGVSTLICRGAQLGAEGPVTVDNCRIGPEVELKGGYFRESVFLERAAMGLGAHVREGCLLEEESSGAHCVGLKQTILFPFVTLGSLINLCDCLMSGGTDRRNHSEVGSSYIHFNFTPEGDKTTASLIGDVPRGVMLNQPPIFLGGQGGAVGPLRVGFGNVIAAGSILRKDVLEEGKLIVPRPHKGATLDLAPGSYPTLRRVLEHNFLYIGNLIALEQWYRHVREPFLSRFEFGGPLLEGALQVIRSGIAERIKRLRAMADKISRTLGDTGKEGSRAALKVQFCEGIDRIGEQFDQRAGEGIGTGDRDGFLDALEAGKSLSGDYTGAVKALSPQAASQGTRWLDSIVNTVRSKALSALTPAGSGAF